jgi:S4 domain/RS4NT (NUC023) domain
MLGKLEGIWAPKPSCGPHNGRECLPLIIIVRNRLKYALTKAEANMICMQKLVKVDGKVRTDLNFPAGFMGKQTCHSIASSSNSALQSSLSAARSSVRAAIAEEHTV